MTYSAIAKALCITPRKVQTIIEKELAARAVNIGDCIIYGSLDTNRPRKTLERYMRNVIKKQVTSLELLCQDIGLTQKERASKMNSKFHTRSIDQHRISQFFKEKKVRKKVLIELKKGTWITLALKEKAEKNAAGQLYRCHTNGIKVIYVDETLFTYETFASKECSPVNVNFHVRL